MGRLGMARSIVLSSWKVRWFRMSLYGGRRSREVARITQDGGRGLGRSTRITHINLYDDTPPYCSLAFSSCILSFCCEKCLWKWCKCCECWCYCSVVMVSCITLVYVSLLFSCLSIGCETLCYLLAWGVDLKAPHGQEVGVFSLLGILAACLWVWWLIIALWTLVSIPVEKKSYHVFVYWIVYQLYLLM